MDEDRREKKPREPMPVWVKSSAILAVAAVLCYKAAVTPVTLQFDFPAFLSLLLAVFSVALAAMFYFKATDSSNAFYDNTYKFTREIASLLVKIESGFGERLRHLDDAYKGMQTQFEKWPTRMQVNDAKTEVKKEEEQLERITKERENLLAALIDQTQLGEEEKNKFLADLKEKELALQKTRQELSFLQDRLAETQRSQFRPVEDKPALSVHPDIRDTILDAIFRSPDSDTIFNEKPTGVQKWFAEFSSEMSPHTRTLMNANGMLFPDGSLTPYGVRVVRRIAGNFSA